MNVTFPEPAPGTHDSISWFVQLVYNCFPCQFFDDFWTHYDKPHLYGCLKFVRAPMEKVKPDYPKLKFHHWANAAWEKWLIVGSHVDAKVAILGTRSFSRRSFRTLDRAIIFYHRTNYTARLKPSQIIVLEGAAAAGGKRRPKEGKRRVRWAL